MIALLNILSIFASRCLNENNRRHLETPDNIFDSSIVVSEDCDDGDPNYLLQLTSEDDQEIQTGLSTDGENTAFHLAIDEDVDGENMEYTGRYSIEYRSNDENSKTCIFIDGNESNQDINDAMPGRNRRKQDKTQIVNITTINKDDSNPQEDEFTPRTSVDKFIFEKSIDQDLVVENQYMSDFPSTVDVMPAEYVQTISAPKSRSRVTWTGDEDAALLSGMNNLDINGARY